MRRVLSPPLYHSLTTRDSSTHYALRGGKFSFVMTGVHRVDDDNVVSACGLVSFIHTSLVGELIRSWEQGRSGAERMRRSIGLIGRGCCEEAKFAFPQRVSTPICSALERWLHPRKKKKEEEARERRAASHPFFRKEKIRICILWRVLCASRPNNTV